MKIAEIIITEDVNEPKIDSRPVIARIQNNLLELSRYLRHYCQRYITMIGGLENALFNHPLYRGVRSEDLINMHLTQQSPFDTINIRKDRMPMDTPKNVTNLIDNWFEERIGVRFRIHSLFCSGSASLAGGYGTNIVIVPIGDFDYCWSENFRDMYEALENYAEAAYESDEDEHQLAYMNTKDKIRKTFEYSGNLDYFMDNANYQIDKDLLAGVQSGHEIMIAGNKAVVIYSQWLLEAQYHYKNEGWKI